MFRKIPWKKSQTHKNYEDSDETVVELVYLKLSGYREQTAKDDPVADYRKLASPDLVLDVHRLSGDIETTAQLLRVLYRLHVVDVILEAIDVEAANKEFGAQLGLLAAESYYQEALKFCDEIVDLYNAGKIVNSQEIHSLLMEWFEAILGGWKILKLRFI